MPTQPNALAWKVAAGQFTVEELDAMPGGTVLNVVDKSTRKTFQIEKATSQNFLGGISWHVYPMHDGRRGGMPTSENSTEVARYYVPVAEAGSAEEPTGNNPAPTLGLADDVEKALSELILRAKRAQTYGPTQSKKMFFHLLGVLNQIGVIGRAYDVKDVGYLMRVYKAFGHLSGAKPTMNFSASAKIATILDHGTLTDLVKAEVESMVDELPHQERREAVNRAHVTPAVKEKAHRFQEAVELALSRWVGNNMDKLNLDEGPLAGKSAVAEIVDTMMVLRGGAAFLYFMEHEESGVGTWDGDWDVLFKTPRPTIEALSQFVLHATKQPHQGLKDALFDAALDCMPEEEISKEAAQAPTARALDASFGHYRTMRDDPKWMQAKYPGVADDGTTFQRGAKVLYWPRTKTFMVGPKADAAWKKFQAEAADEATMSGDRYGLSQE